MQSKTSPKTADDAKNLKQTRRRLSVMSDNKLIEGMDGVNLETPDATPEVIITRYLDYSKYISDY
jgi:hypothetical protein